MWCQLLEQPQAPPPGPYMGAPAAATTTTTMPGSGYYPPGTSSTTTTPAAAELQTPPISGYPSVPPPSPATSNEVRAMCMGVIRNQ